ncbi:hypothetical protein OG21DRAFT_1525768 [Imleria badia]|nr:hypothetical protein OG21DRAFT_1525768 [Imleria badia]
MSLRPTHPASAQRTHARETRNEKTTHMDTRKGLKVMPWGVPDRNRPSNQLPKNHGERPPRSRNRRPQYSAKRKRDSRVSCAGWKSSTPNGCLVQIRTDMLDGDSPALCLWNAVLASDPPSASANERRAMLSGSVQVVRSHHTSESGQWYPYYNRSSNVMTTNMTGAYGLEQYKKAHTRINNPAKTEGQENGI